MIKKKRVKRVGSSSKRRISKKINSKKGKKVNLYEDTNRVLILTLNKNIGKEEKLISDLIKKERELQKRISKENALIKGEGVINKRKRLLKGIKEADRRMVVVKKQLNSKRKLLNQYDKVILLLEKEIDVIYDSEKLNDKGLREKFSSLLLGGAGKSMKEFKIKVVGKIKFLTSALNVKQNKFGKIVNLEQRKGKELVREETLKRVMSKLRKELRSLRDTILSLNLEEKKIEKKFVLIAKYRKKLSKIVDEKLNRIHEHDLIVKELKRIKTMIAKKNSVSKKVKQKLAVEFSMNRVTDKNEMKLFLQKMDKYLGSLPEKDIEKFAKSKDYQLYKRILKRYEVV